MRKKYDDWYYNMFAIYKSDSKAVKPERTTDALVRAEADMLVVKTGIDSTVAQAKALKKYVETMYDNADKWINTMKKQFDRETKERFNS